MKQIIANSEFRQYWTAFPLVCDDINAYEVVLNQKSPFTGTFTVTAKKPSGAIQFVSAAVSGTRAAVTLKNAMYDVPGETELYLVLYDSSGGKVTEKVIVVEVEAGTGEGKLSNDEVTRLDGLMGQTAAQSEYAREQGDYAKAQGDYAASETSEWAQKINDKVDKIDGKGLSEKDYTAADQSKVALIIQGNGNPKGVTLGSGSSTASGGAVGPNAKSYVGFGGGLNANAYTGAAVGVNAKTEAGFSGGSNAITQNAYGTAIDAIQLGTGTNQTAKTLQVYNYQLLDAAGKIPAARIPDNVKSTNDYTAADKAKVAGLEDALSAKVDKETGKGLSTCDYSSSDRGKVNYITLSTQGPGIAMGYQSSSIYGGAFGNRATTSGGGSIGQGASSDNGGAVGNGVSVRYGGAIGQGAKTSDGFAGGANAKTQNEQGTAIDAVQLGTGTNTTANTMQVYDYQLLDASGKIPAERIPDNIKSSNDYTTADKSKVALITSGTGYPKGVTLGTGASTASGGAVGPNAKSYVGFAGGMTADAYTGAAVGANAKTSDGFAGGANAQTQNAQGTAIDAVQLGTGVNATAKTLQVYTYQLMDANGNIPIARMQEAITLINALADRVAALEAHGTLSETK